MASDNSEALAQIGAMIRMLKDLGNLPSEVAPHVAAAVREQLEEQIASAQFPSGSPWPDTLEGKKALRNAASALDVKAIGTVIVARLSGVEARHSVGAVRGHVQRQILPSSSRQLEAIGNAVSEVLLNATRSLLKGVK